MINEYSKEKLEEIFTFSILKNITTEIAEKTGGTTQWQNSYPRDQTFR